MISEIRVRARASSMEEAEREIDIVLDHARMAGYLEGVVPQSSSVTDNQFGRVHLPDRWTDVLAADDEPGFLYEGRVVLRFDPERPHDGGLKEYGYRVVVSEEEVRDELRSAEDGRECTDEVIVLRRARPATRDSVLATLETWRAPKPTAEEMAAFAELAVCPEVQEIAFGPAKSRPGYEIDLMFFVPFPPPTSANAPNGVTVSVSSSFSSNDAEAMGLGGRECVYGDTFGEAVAAARAFVESVRSRG